MRNFEWRGTKILWISLSIALVFHLAALVFFANLKVDFYSVGKAYFQNHIADEDLKTRTNEDAKRRNEQLAALFKDIEGLHSDESIKANVFLPDNDQPLLTSSKGDISFDANQFYHMEIDLLTQPDKLVSMPAETHAAGPIADKFTSFRQQKNVEFLDRDQHVFDDDMIKAAMIVQGTVTTSALNFDLSNALSVGTIKQSELQGNSLEMRSGLLHEGRSESDVGGGNQLTSGDDLGILKFTGFHQQPGSGYKNPVLPVVNKDHLRGFDASTVETAIGSDDFDLKVEYAFVPEEKHYLFKLSLQPKPRIKFKKIAQNFFFLIDRSHSIRYQRYLFTKHAVINALKHLSAGDSFNILLFDDHVERFSPENVLWTSENVEKARQWLLPRRHGGVYGSTDLYTSLGDIVPEAVEDNEVNTAILFSDGDTYLSLEKQRKAISVWEEKNLGKVSLFSVAAGRGNHLDLLSYLSYLNKGLLYYASADAELDLILQGIMEDVGNPVGKEIAVSAVSQDAEQRIAFFLNGRQLPDLYGNRPFVVFGTTNKPAEFHLFFQGKHYEKPLDIRQTVSFDRAEKVAAEAIVNQFKMNQKTL